MEKIFLMAELMNGHPQNTLPSKKAAGIAMIQVLIRQLPAIETGVANLTALMLYKEAGQSEPLLIYKTTIYQFPASWFFCHTLICRFCKFCLPARS